MDHSPSQPAAPAPHSGGGQGHKNKKIRSFTERWPEFRLGPGRCDQKMKKIESEVIGIPNSKPVWYTVVAVYTGTGIYDMKCRLALRAKSDAFGAVCVVGT